MSKSRLSEIRAKAERYLMKAGLNCRQLQILEKYGYFSGVKKVEFREAKPYWQTRIANWARRMHEGRTPVIEFQSGYGRYSPRMAFIAGRGEGLFFARFAADDPVQHKELGEFPKARYALFIGERVVLEYELKKNEANHALYQR